jgi:hypothetical protein
VVLVVFDDQIIPFVALRRTKIPGWVMVRTPEVSVRGVSLLATHTTVLVVVEIFLYHIPKYRLFEFPGLKNPSSKLPPADTIVSASLIESVGVIVSSAMDSPKIDNKREDRKSSLKPSIGFFVLYAQGVLPVIKPVNITCTEIRPTEVFPGFVWSD